MRPKSAFTLIEILVVIAIIVILAAILFPSFSTARENSRKTVCQSNLKQLGMGMLQYLQDYDERFIPATRTGLISDTPALSWTVALNPYIKSRQIFRCPSNIISPLGGNTFTGTTNTLNYTYNADVAGRACGSTLTATAGRPLSQFQFTPQTPLLVEAVGIPYVAGNEQVDQSLIFFVAGAVKADFTVMQGRALNNPANLSIATPWIGTPPVNYPATNYGITMGAPGANIHFGCANFLFVDGHVKSLKTPIPVPPAGSLAPVPGDGLDYCPDGVLGTTTTYG